MDYSKRTKNELIVRGYTKRTIDQYVMYITDFISYTKAKSIDLESLTEENIISYLAFKKEKLTNTSLAMVYSAVHFFVKHTLKSTAINDIKMPKKGKYLPTVLSKEEVKVLLDTVDKKEKRNKLIIELLYSSGLRVSELCDLKLENIDINQALLNIKSGKGDKDRIVILSKKWIDDYIKFAKKFFKNTPKEYVFCKKNGKPLSPDTIQKIIRDVAKESGIHKHVTPHTIRHSFATHLLEAGENIRKIQTLLGHASLSTTQIYTKVSTNEIKKTKSPLDSL